MRLQFGFCTLLVGYRVINRAGYRVINRVAELRYSMLIHFSLNAPLHNYGDFPLCFVHTSYLALNVEVDCFRKIQLVISRLSMVESQSLEIEDCSFSVHTQHSRRKYSVGFCGVYLSRCRCQLYARFVSRFFYISYSLYPTLVLRINQSRLLMDCYVLAGTCYQCRVVRGL